MGADRAVALFPALLGTKEFTEELHMEGQGRRKVRRVLEQSFWKPSSRHLFFPLA